MPTSLDGKVALVTGANKGLGRETARRLGARGAVVLVGTRDGGRGRVAAEQLSQEGADARFVRLDVTEPDTIEETRDRIDREFGRLDILVNNAGVSRWSKRPRSAESPAPFPSRSSGRPSRPMSSG